MIKLIVIDKNLAINPDWVEAVNFDADKQETIITLRGGHYMGSERTKVSFEEVINKLNQESKQDKVEFDRDGVVDFTVPKTIDLKGKIYGGE